MDQKIMYAALLFVVGWFYFYICLRAAYIFDFTVAYPLIKKFGDAVVMASVGAKPEHHLRRGLAHSLCRHRVCGDPLLRRLPYGILFLRRLGRLSRLYR